MNTPGVECIYFDQRYQCHNLITDLDDCWYSVKGWDRNRKDGGTNAVALRERTGLIMCNSCMEKEKDRLDSGQGTLL